MLISLRVFSYALAFVWLLDAATCACHEEYKSIDEQITIPCTNNDPTTVTWRFDNHSQINSTFSGVVVSQDTRSIMIQPRHVSVYGDYSCFDNDGTLINCYSVYIRGIV